MNIDKTDYMSYLMKLFNKFEAKQVLTAFWRSMKIQDGRHENPRWRLSDVMWRHSWDMIFISRRLINGVNFMSIPSIVFKKWRGAFDAPASTVQGRPKKPSLSRVKNVLSRPKLNRLDIWSFLNKHPTLHFTEVRHLNPHFVTKCNLFPYVTCSFVFHRYFKMNFSYI